MSAKPLRGLLKLNENLIKETIEKTLAPNDHLIQYNRKEHDLRKEHSRMTQLAEIIERHSTSLSPREIATYVIIPKEDYSIFRRIFNRNVFSDIQKALDRIHNPHPGGLIWIKEGGYVQGAPLTIPNATKSLTLIGASGFGKSYSEGGGYFGTHIKKGWSGAPDPLFQTNYTNDARSVFGLNFDRLKLEGDYGANSKGIQLNNVDGVDIKNCFFLGFAKAIVAEFLGPALPVAERPGIYWIHNTLFSEGQVEYIRLCRCTQVFIYENMFESWGPFTRHIILYGTEKTRIGPDNEFNHNNNPSTMTDYINLHSLASPYMCHGIQIHDNWAWFHQNSTRTMKWILTTGVDNMYDIVSRNNLLHYAWDIRTDPTGGYCPYQDPMLGNYDDIMRFFNMEPEDRLHDVKGGTAETYLVDTIYQHKWSPVVFNITVQGMGNTSSTECRFEMSNNGTAWYPVAILRSYEDETTSDGEPLHTHWVEIKSCKTFTVLVPTGYWFRLIDGSATVVGWAAIYR